MRACVSLAVSEPRRSEAIRYLRRAAELVLPPAQLQRCSSSSTDNGAARMAKRSGSRRSGQRAAGSAEDGEEGQLMVQAPGLSAELAQFVVSHRGEAYSAVALKWFGNELMRGGFPDQVRRLVVALAAACMKQTRCKSAAVVSRMKRTRYKRSARRSQVQHASQQGGCTGVCLLTGEGGQGIEAIMEALRANCSTHPWQRRDCMRFGRVAMESAPCGVHHHTRAGRVQLFLQGRLPHLLPATSVQSGCSLPLAPVAC